MERKNAILGGVPNLTYVLVCHKSTNSEISFSFDISCLFFEIKQIISIPFKELLYIDVDNMNLSNSRKRKNRNFGTFFGRHVFVHVLEFIYKLFQSTRL